MTDEIETFDDVMDRAAVALAKKVLFEANGSESSGLVDLFKSFEILDKYAERQATRLASEAPKPRTKTDDLRGRFHGHTTPRRGNPRKAKADEAEPDAASDLGSAANAA